MTITTMRKVPLGYVQVADLSSAVGLSDIPTGTTYIEFVPEGQDIRYRDDGEDPAADEGMLIAKGTLVSYTGTVQNIKFIETTSGAKLNVSFYKVLF